MIISILVTFTHNYNIYPQVMGQNSLDFIYDIKSRLRPVRLCLPNFQHK